MVMRIVILFKLKDGGTLLIALTGGEEEDE